MKVFFLFCTAFLMTGCSLVLTDDNEAMDVAARWAEAYFNYDFHEAEQYVTPESGRWLRFAASNTTEHDLQLAQEDGEAIVDVDDFFTEANDTLRIVIQHIEWTRQCLTSRPYCETESGRLEWKAYRKVKSKVATETRVQNREMILLILIGWIDSFHTHIETYDKIVEIEAKTQSVANSNLLPEL